MIVSLATKVVLWCSLGGIFLGLGGVLATLLAKDEKLFIAFGCLMILCEVIFGLAFISIM
jgi:hypothetical protein